jgi:hypothetical protein
MAQRLEDQASLFSGAAAEFGNENGRGQLGDDFAGMAGENAALGASDAIFRKMADHFKERGAHGIV